MNCDEINKLLNTKNQWIKKLKNKNYGMDNDLEYFIKNISLLTAQSASVRIENRVSKDFELKKISPSIDLGDFIDYKGNYYEFKASILNETNDCLNIVQIRLWQEIQYYLLIAFDIRDLNNFRSYMFILTKQQMIEEMKLVKACAAHGTKKANEFNLNTELRYSLKINQNSDVYKRWLKDYLYCYDNFKDDFLNKL